MTSFRRARRLGPLILVAVTAMVVAGASAQGDELDPARDAPLPCELIASGGQVPRSAHNIVHVANVCGFVGTDMEFQSRTDASGKLHDYAFVGTMGAGLRIFDVTNPTHPAFAGAYTDPGWEDDIQVRGDVATVNFDPLVVGIELSLCLREKNTSGSTTRGGVDILNLNFNPASATFAPTLRYCYLNQSGGAHNATFHPNGQWLAVDTSASGIEVVDLRGAQPVFVRKIPSGVAASAHDVFFSRDGNTLYSAGIGSTRIVDVTDIFNRDATLIANIPNVPLASQNPDGQTISISHQSDTTSDGKLLAITDERGGGLSNTACNQGPSGVIGGMHFWALTQIDGITKSTGASVSTPKKIGTWIYPNPNLALDPIGRPERACTIHVFRFGGNGSTSPGPVQAGFDGVSRLPVNQTVTAHYGAGVWYIDSSGPPTSTDGTVEDTRTTWGNTLGWNIMPGADTWSAKEYKGFIYTGDMGRGFDVYGFTRCDINDGRPCVGILPNTPGKATGGGQIDGSMAEMSILQGTGAGGRANFGFNAQYTAGLPTGQMTYIDHDTGASLKATSIDTFIVDDTGTTATFNGRGKTNNGSLVDFTVTVKDMGEPGNADTLTIQWPGYTSSGVLINGNIQVRKGA